MTAGDIILVSLPQADGKIKKRPALLLKQMPGHGDWLVCGISTQVHHFIAGFDEKLDSTHPDYNTSGLKAESIIRLGFLTVIPSVKIPGTIGSIGTSVLKKLTSNLIRHLKN